MQIESIENHKDDFKANSQRENETMICKDGFCYLPDSNKTKESNLEKINIFDPI